MLFEDTVVSEETFEGKGKGPAAEANRMVDEKDQKGVCHYCQSQVGREHLTMITCPSQPGREEQQRKHRCCVQDLQQQEKVFASHRVG